MALANDHDFKLVAILFRKNKIIKIGTNSKKTHPRFRRKMKGVDVYSLHAEMGVLRWAEPGDRLVVYRFNANGLPTMAKPCNACMSFIKEAGIKKISYSDWDGNVQTIKV